jgi:hypothetical protein
MVKLNNLQPSAAPTNFNQANAQFAEQPSQTQSQSTSLISIPPALMQVIP